MIFEEKKKEEWFFERYLPSLKYEKSVEWKKTWAKGEAERFKVSGLDLAWSFGAFGAYICLSLFSFLLPTAPAPASTGLVHCIRIP